MGVPALACTERSLNLLVLSFDRLLCRLGDGRLRLDRLDRALFYLDAGRENVIDPTRRGPDRDRVLIQFRQRLEQGREIHRGLVAALSSGECEGRVRWREEDGTRSYRILNALLVANRLPAPFPEGHIVLGSGIGFFEAVAIDAVRRSLPYMDVLASVEGLRAVDSPR